MSMTIVVGGDIVPSFKNVDPFSAGNVEKLIDAACLGVLKSADFRIYNLETPITDQTTPIKKDGANFSVGKTCVNGLKELQANAVNIANNHCLDQGEQGILATIKVLEENGIKPTGYAKGKDGQSVDFFTIQDCTVAIVSCAEKEFTICSEKTVGAAAYHDYWTNKCITEAKEKSDLVIVLYHGGKEYYRYAAPYQQDRCRLMVDAGADVVICQHSHCISCYEYYKDAYILYGQGNFIFHQRNERPMTKEGLLLKISWEGGVRTVCPYPVYLDQDDRVCLAGGELRKEILQGLEERSSDLREHLQDKYDEFAQENVDAYFGKLDKSTGISGLLSRVDRCIFKGKYSEEELLRLKNILQNEAHRELFLAGIDAILEKGGGRRT